MYTLKRPLNDWEHEYEVQHSMNELEQNFYTYFIDYIKEINLDIAEYQIIINPIRFKMEIRIKMKKLNICFANEFGLGMLLNGRSDYLIICESMMHLIKDYATSLCYRNKEE